MEYIEIPSRLNHLTLEEIEELDKDDFMPLFNKLIDVQANMTLNHSLLIKDFATNLARLDVNVPNVKNIHYNSVRDIYVAVKVINKKKYHIKQSKDISECLQAYNEFCKLHKVKP